MTAADEAECKLLSDLVQEHFGLSFSGVRRDILASRIRPRLSALRLGSLLDYYHYLRTHPQRDGELEQLVRHLTNNETYFFREPHHFDIVVRHVVPPLMPLLKERPLRALSVGCSSGEEPYTLAVALHDAGLELRGVRWEIDACDLNPDRLARAREAAYEGAALRACSDDALRRCFDERDGRWLLRDCFRRGVRFFEANLATAASLGRPPYDVVFCRNLLIYFDDAGFDRAVRVLARTLPPGGYLLLGHSESLIDRTDEFTPVWLDGAMVYRKREAA
ncbi:MAG TPA: protein-glutamate O-methyltransferase CheR [Gemmatimonadales bacterium]|jgi:chemotaxis protein methyltransferase CheR|nr:protein-glutamate O-methyltransferase CheR [Gemmatimonadales bacterium]